MRCATSEAVDNLLPSELFSWVLCVSEMVLGHSSYFQNNLDVSSVLLTDCAVFGTTEQHPKVSCSSGSGHLVLACRSATLYYI